MSTTTTVPVKSFFLLLDLPAVGSFVARYVVCVDDELKSICVVVVAGGRSARTASETCVHLDLRAGMDLEP